MWNATDTMIKMYNIVYNNVLLWYIVVMRPHHIAYLFAESPSSYQ